MRLFAVVSYSGANYFGWQKQPNVLTIQEVIEKEISKIFNREITIYGAGRTDAGVHAIGQTFHFDVEVDHIDLDRFLYSINQMLPDDIKIVDIEEVDPSFHARFSAKSKDYVYSLFLEAKNPFLKDYNYLYPHEIDVEKLKDLLTHFVGEHNFKNFTSKEEDKDDFIRNIYSIDVQREGKCVQIFFSGNGFMRYMIRLIVGTVIHCLEKDLDEKFIDSLLDENSERNVVSYKAPACGLLLAAVEY